MINRYSLRMSLSIPPNLKPIGPFIRLANDNAKRDPVVYYWCLYYAIQSGMKLDRSPDSVKYMESLLGTLELIKKQLISNEAITNEIVAQAHLEEYAFKIFGYANGREQNGDVDNKVAQAFNSAGHLLDVLNLFGELDDNVASTKKYAKWKATQILQSIKNGTPYVPSTKTNDEDPELNSIGYSSIPNTNPFDLPGVPDMDNILNQPGVPLPPSEHSYSNISNIPQSPPLSFIPSTPSIPPRSTIPPSSQSQSTTYNTVPQDHHISPPSNVPYIPGSLGLDSLNEAKKHCKWAMSAIDYEDIPAVIDNLKKALAIVERR